MQWRSPGVAPRTPSPKVGPGRPKSQVSHLTGCADPMGGGGRMRSAATPWVVAVPLVSAIRVVCGDPRRPHGRVAARGPCVGNSRAVGRCDVLTLSAPAPTATHLSETLCCSISPSRNYRSASSWACCTWVRRGRAVQRICPEGGILGSSNGPLGRMRKMSRQAGCHGTTSETPGVCCRVACRILWGATALEECTSRDR